MRIGELKPALDRLYESFNCPDSASDPIQIVRRWRAPADREIVGFCAAALAFGRVSSVLQSIERLLALMEGAPADFVRQFDPRAERAAFAALGHRWTRGPDLAALLWIVRQMIDRSGSIEAFFLEGYDPSAVDVEAALDSFSSRALGLDAVGPHDSFFELGGDSIMSVQLVSRARARGVGLSPKLVFDHQTVAALAAVAGVADIRAEQGVVTGEAPLTPIQHWYFTVNPVRPERFEQSVTLTLVPDVDEAALRTALNALLAHHDALRIRFTRTGDGWRQYNVPVEPADVWQDGDFDLARERAADIARYDGIRLVEDSLDLETCEGAATIGLELVDTVPSFDTVLIALGAGRWPPVWGTW